MLSTAVFAFALALVSAVQGAPATGTEGLAKRTFASQANGDCYFSCPALPGGSHLQHGEQLTDARYSCMYDQVPNVSGGIVECDYHPTTGASVGGPYVMQGASWPYACPAVADQKGNCASQAARRQWARVLSPLEQKIKARQFNPRTKRAESVAKFSRP